MTRPKATRINGTIVGDLVILDIKTWKKLLRYLDRVGLEVEVQDRQAAAGDG